MIITKLPANRWQEYKQLRLESIQESPQSFLDTVVETEALPDLDWQRKMENMFFAVTDDDRIVGMIGCYREDKSKLHHIGNVVSFYVTPSFQGQGIGKALLNTVIAHAKSLNGLKKLQLGVITTQKAAQKLYETTGFQKVGEAKMSVCVDEKLFDEHLMELYL